MRRIPPVTNQSPPKTMVPVIRGGRRRERPISYLNRYQHLLPQEAHNQLSHIVPSSCSVHSLGGEETQEKLTSLSKAPVHLTKWSPCVWFTPLHLYKPMSLMRFACVLGSVYMSWQIPYMHKHSHVPKCTHKLTAKQIPKQS